ncbi:MAG: hypothetical protein J6L96_06445 [Clostridia bacterium]|nr:hypothetical protein [Clostridia bacterium]
MEHKRIIPVLISLLTVSCLVLGLILFSLNRKNNYLPNESIESLVSILEADGIKIDPEIISPKVEHGTVYLSASEDYQKTVATLIGGDHVKATYGTPEGQIMIMESGAMFDFGSNFSFSYYADGEPSDIPDLWDGTYISGHFSDAKYKEIAKIAADFLDLGSGDFDTDGKMSVVTVADNILERDGVYYVICSRTIDGVEITDNTVLCTVTDGEVTSAYGTWCFLTLGESYSAQLADILNILFNVKKEIVSSRGDKGEVTIVGIEKCYSLYFYGENEEFCLIPCLKIVTDSMGEFIYNAIDSTLYTKN